AWESATPVLLFTARDSNGSRQPITAKPAVATHPHRDNTLVVMFGTGSYFRRDDAGDNQVQTLYGVFDTVAGSSNLVRGDLLGQQITWQGTDSFSVPGGGTLTHELREVSQHQLTPSHDGWYLDLIYGGVAEGERVISAPTFPSGVPQNRVRFTTIIPNTDDPCTSSRSGFLMDLDMASGGRYAKTVFDLNLDDEFDSEDWPNDGPPSGVGFGTGETPT